MFGKFFVGAVAVLLVVVTMWVALSAQVVENSTNVERNREELRKLAEDLDRKFDKILMELRK